MKKEVKEEIMLREKACEDKNGIDQKLNQEEKVLKQKRCSTKQKSMDVYEDITLEPNEKVDNFIKKIKLKNEEEAKIIFAEKRIQEETQREKENEISLSMASLVERAKHIKSSVETTTTTSTSEISQQDEDGQQ